MTTATTKTVSGAVVVASIDGGRVIIEQDGAQVGAGKWDGRRIVDCSARLGAANGSETDATFDALDAALVDAVEEAEGAALLMSGYEATLTDATATREARIEAAARLCRAADEEQAVEGDAPMTWQSSGEQIGTVETMQQACDGDVTGADWRTFAAAY